MRRSLVLVVLVVLAILATTSVARAEPGPRFAIGLDQTIGTGGHVEALELGWRLETGGFVRVGRWHATVSLPVHFEVTSARPERDTEQLFGVGVATRLAYRLPVADRGALSIAAGLTRRWMLGSGTVVRGCRQTGACVAGFYPETPSYSGWAPQLRLGIGPEKRLPTMVVGLMAELVVEAISFDDVPPAGIRGVAVTAALTFSLGGGPRRRQNL